MSDVIDNMDGLPALLAARRAVAVIAVAWSPWHRESRAVLGRLETTRSEWSPGRPVGFFILWPESDAELNRWYEAMCQHYLPHFELHGHGYAPLWWLKRGEVVDCLSKPYETELAALQDRSAAALGSRG